MDAASFIQNSWRTLRNIATKTAPFENTKCPPECREKPRLVDLSPCVDIGKPCVTSSPPKVKTPSASAALVGALSRRVPKAPKLPTSPSCKPSASIGLSARTEDSNLHQPALGEATESIASTCVADCSRKEPTLTVADSSSLQRTPSSPSSCFHALEPAIELSPSPVVPAPSTETPYSQSSGKKEMTSPLVESCLDKQGLAVSYFPCPESKTETNGIISVESAVLGCPSAGRTQDYGSEQNEYPGFLANEGALRTPAAISSQAIVTAPSSPPSHGSRVSTKARPPPILTGDCLDQGFVPTIAATNVVDKSPSTVSMPTSQHSATPAKATAADYSTYEVPPSESKFTSTPSSSGGHRSIAISPKEDRRCQGVRGENPYRRKWNPRLAAAHRRDLENAKKEKEESKPKVEIHHGSSLADCLTSEADAFAEAEARAAVVEASEAEARAVALAEYAAQTNLADQRFTRQQDSAVNMNPVSSQTVPADTETGDFNGNSASKTEYGTARSGISLAAPLDRGPEHRPVGSSRGQPLPALVDGERPVLPSPRSRPTAYHPERPPHRKADARSPSPRSQRTFSFCNSPVISDAIDADGFAQAELFNARVCLKSDSEKQFSLDSVQLGEQHFQSRKPEERPPLEPDAPRRAMAEIRAAAERRAYSRNVAEDEVSNDLAPAPLNEAIESTLSNAVESRRNMSAIRAIAERRAGGFRASSTTPRGNRTPISYEIENGQSFDEFSQSQINESYPVHSAALVPHAQVQPRTPKEGGEMSRCGGAYKPSRIYSSRANGGAGRSEALGLKFGQPPAR